MESIRGKVGKDVYQELQLMNDSIGQKVRSILNAAAEHARNTRKSYVAFAKQYPLIAVVIN